jgi:hypothetical protein
VFTKIVITKGVNSRNYVAKDPDPTKKDKRAQRSQFTVMLEGMQTPDQ